MGYVKVQSILILIRVI